MFLSTEINVAVCEQYDRAAGDGAGRSTHEGQGHLGQRERKRYHLQRFLLLVHSVSLKYKDNNLIILKRTYFGFQCCVKKIH